MKIDHIHVDGPDYTGLSSTTELDQRPIWKAAKGSKTCKSFSGKAQISHLQKTGRLIRRLLGGLYLVGQWNKENKMEASESIRLAVIIGSFSAMLGGLWLIAARLKAKNQGFGPNSLKALGIVLLVPGLFVVAVALPQFQTETLAALLGTVAGYALSHSRADDA